MKGLALDREHYAGYILSFIDNLDRPLGSNISHIEG
jgi:hypothetical protein